MPQNSDPYSTVIITHIKEETPGVKTFTITNEDGSAIPYTAGQFITFVFTHHGREERRSYSISSNPAVAQQLMFTVKRIDNGAYSRLLADRAAVGDKLYTTGAAGLFTLQPGSEEKYKQIFFFAAGIGITPIYSLITTLLRTNDKIHLVLIYSNRSKEEAVFFDELHNLCIAHPDNFKADFLYSTSFNLMRARLNKALVPQLLKEYSVCPKEEQLFYICGPYDYMRMVIYALEEQGIHNEQIRKENFNTNDRAAQKIAPPDTDEHRVTIRFKGAEHLFTVQYPETILQAARKNGLQLPYSCETGRCGSCAAICTSGKVWLSYNEVLMDMDLKHGSILTCVGYPVGGDVRIEV